MKTEEKNIKTFTKKEAIEESTKYFNGDKMAADVWLKKYALRDVNGNIYELTPKDMHHRLASEFARIEKKYKSPLSEEQIFDVIKEFKYIVPQGSPMAGIGNNFQYMSISNCYVIGNDSDADSYGGILKLDQELVQLQKRRAGVGIDISFVRPEGSIVKNSALTSTGVVPFMERFSNSTKEVAQDGRRGALLESISIIHPDAEKFIDAKTQEGKVTGANISVRISDEFMEAALSGKPFKQQYPITGKNPKVLQEVDASTLWKKIIHNSWKVAEPGVLFWDTIIKESIPDCYADMGFKTVSTNPCFPSSEYLLTENGYVKFGDLYTCKSENMVFCDNRISYFSEDGNEKAENWRINNNLSGVTRRNASHVFLTQKEVPIVEITTVHGFKLRCTFDHHIATTVGMVEAGRLTSSHKILISVIDKNNNETIVGKKPENPKEILSMLVGLITGDGTFDKSRPRAHLDFWGNDKERMKDMVINFIDILYEQFGDRFNSKGRKYSKYFIVHSKDGKKIRISSSWLNAILAEFGFGRYDKFDVPDFIMNNSMTNIGKYYVAGLMYCDASVQGSEKSGFTVRLSQSNIKLLRKVQMILHSNGMLFGIYKRRDAKKTKLPNGRGEMSEYNTKEQYELISINGSLVKYREKIGFLGDPNKERKMAVNHNFIINEVFDDFVLEINSAGNEDVFCIKEDVSKSIIVNGISTRRCGEIPLCPHDSCRLLAINLFSYVENPFTKESKFNFDLFKVHVNIAMRMMDDLVDLELEKTDSIIQKIQEDPEEEKIKRTELELWYSIQKKAVQGRRTGLGITAEGDMLAALGLTYGADKAIDFSEKVHKTLKLEAYRSSVEMAKERGHFEIWNPEKEKNNPFLKRIKEEDSELYKEMMVHGRRNIALLTIAPTGTVSLMTRTTSGIEPVFKPIYKRRRKINPQEKDTKTDFTDKQGESWQEYTVFHNNFELWLKINNYDIEAVKKMSEEEIDGVVKKSPYYKATAHDVDWVKKVEMQGRVQKHVDHSISSTTNLPEGVSEDIVSKVYETGWKSGCKGITVYREGSREGVLISNSEKKQSASAEINAVKRPKVVNADVIQFQNNYEKWVAIIGKVAPEEGAEERPYELFTGKLDSFNIPPYVEKGQIIKRKEKNKSGEVSSIYDFKYIDKDGYPVEMAGLSRSFNKEYWNYAKLISGLLRQRMPIQYVASVVAGLKMDDADLNTWKNGVVRIINKYIKDGTQSKNTCEHCGAKLVYSEGCLKCEACGKFSRCG